MNSAQDFELDFFHLPDGTVTQPEHYGFELQVGNGLILKEQRLRVVDIWYSTDQHGVHDWGRHVYFEDVTGTDDDRPGREDPSYYSL